MNLDKIYLNIAMINECTKIEGPGKRFCIWLQGCNIGCKNCINQDMLSFEVKQLFTIKQLQEYILKSKNKYNIEGVTFLGGEPFLQSQNLFYLAQYCQSINLTIMCFSGFQYNQLQNDIVPHSNKLLSYLDILVDGAYNKNLKDTKRNWVGSTNQHFYYLTDKYNSQIETNKKYKNKVEFSIKNYLQINGEAKIIEYIMKA